MIASHRPVPEPITPRRRRPRRAARPAPRPSRRRADRTEPRDPPTRTATCEHGFATAETPIRARRGDARIVPDRTGWFHHPPRRRGRPQPPSVTAPTAARRPNPGANRLPHRVLRPAGRRKSAWYLTAERRRRPRRPLTAHMLVWLWRRPRTTGRLERSANESSPQADSQTGKEARQEAPTATRRRQERQQRQLGRRDVGLRRGVLAARRPHLIARCDRSAVADIERRRPRTESVTGPPACSIS